MKTPKKTKEDNLKILYRQKLKEKGRKLLQYYTNHPQLSQEDINKLNDRYNGKYSWATEAYEDFFAIKRTYFGQNSNDACVRTAYIYNYYMLSCFLYLNRTIQIPWDVTFYWEEIDVTHPNYKNCSLDSLVEETPLDYIEIHLKKINQYNIQNS